MALNWSSGISFSGLKKKTGANKDSFPTKTYMNLAVPDAQEVDLRRSAILGAVLLVLVTGFIKFGVYDFYARLGKASAELATQATTLSALQAQLTNYDEVLEEYNLYESARMVTDSNLVPVLDALEVVDTYVTPQAFPNSIALSNNVLSLNLSGITLDNTGGLVSTLYSLPIVKSVTVASASDSKNSDGGTVTMSITLTPVTEDAQQAEPASE